MKTLGNLFDKKEAKGTGAIEEENITQEVVDDGKLPEWDSIETKEIVSFKQNKLHTLKFLTSNPEKTVNRFGKEVFVFPVKENNAEKLFFVSSIKLSYSLKRLSPLEGKTVQIERKGEGMETEYLVECLEDK